jgi:hypothetical protein
MWSGFPGQPPSLTIELEYRPEEGIPPWAHPSLQELRKRRTHSPEFKARVAIEAISRCKTIQEIASDHAI